MQLLAGKLSFDSMATTHGRTQREWRQYSECWTQYVKTQLVDTRRQCLDQQRWRWLVPYSVPTS